MKYNDRLDCNLSYEPSDQYSMGSNFSNEQASSEYSHMKPNVSKYGKIAFASSLRKPLPQVNMSLRNKNQLYALKMGNSFEVDDDEESNNSSKNIVAFSPFEFEADRVRMGRSNIRKGRE